MQITVFGANGRVGSLVVEQALRQGYKVTAFVHSASGLPPNPNLQVVKGDIYNAADVVAALSGSKVVISALGSWGTPKKDVLTAAMQYIIPAMQVNKRQRIISLTGADARAAGDVMTPIHQLSHVMISLSPGLRKILADGEKHIELLEASDLAWTVIRSPVMNEHSEAGRCRLTSRRPLPWATINRHAVANTLVNLIDDNSYNQQAPFIVHT
jgi:putative NADH-flavin reductase